MAQAEGTRFDVAAVRAAANQFDAGAEQLRAAAATRLGGLAFGPASAGRDYAAEGDALRRALAVLSGVVMQWSRASAEIAAALRVSADRYLDAELRGAARVG